MDISEEGDHTYTFPIIDYMVCVKVLATVLLIINFGDVLQPNNMTPHVADIQLLNSLLGYLPKEGLKKPGLMNKV